MRIERYWQHWIGVILALLFVYQPRVADACSCAGYPGDLESAVAIAYAQADVVFLGDVRSVRKRVFNMPPTREVEFSVRNVWKGSIQDPTLVESNIGEIACGYDFKKNRSYLVFGYWDRHRDIVTTSFCDLTRTEAEAKDLIVILDRQTTTGGEPKSSTSDN